MEEGLLHQRTGFVLSHARPECRNVNVVQLRDCSRRWTHDHAQVDSDALKDVGSPTDATMVTCYVFCVAKVELNAAWEDASGQFFYALQNSESLRVHVSMILYYKLAQT